VSEQDRISLIVLTHNNVGMSLDCLEWLSRAAAGLDHELILLDNASTEDTEPLRACASLFRNCRFLRSDEHLSFSRINNLGAREASGKWLLFLNNDVFVKEDSVARLLRSLHEDASIGIVGPKLLFPDERVVQHAGISQMLWSCPSNYGVGADPLDSRVQEQCERFALTGAMMCLSRELFVAAGGFDERYVWGIEDIDLCLKIRAAGRRVVYVPEASGVHIESATIKVTRKWDAPNNYRVYREAWDQMLVPGEMNYIRQLKTQGIGRVAVFGTGVAARGLAKILDENGIRIEAFTSSTTLTRGEKFLDRPLLPLAALREESYDRLMVASMFYFAVEPLLRDYDPVREPIYPVIQ
jgi:GT2 family glycosyltransferase